MWWLSRCISIDSLNSCFQHQKHRTSYDFCFCKEGSSIFDKQSDDGDDCDSSLHKPARNVYRQQARLPPNHIRRRIPKRYSDIVGPSGTKTLLQRKESTVREKKVLLPPSQPSRSGKNIPRRYSLKPIAENIYSFDSNQPKPYEINYHRPVKYDELLAHRMQAAMGAELMNSLDRNFVSGDRKQPSSRSHISRSRSFNICTPRDEKPELNAYHHLIPRVRTTHIPDEDLRMKEPTPDYDENVIETMESEKSAEKEEPIADYDESTSTVECDIDDKSVTHSELGVSSSFVIPQISSIETTITEERIPTPPPLSKLPADEKKITIRCRTIAESLSSDHKLILKDVPENLLPEKAHVASQQPSKPHYFHVSKNNKLRKVSQSLSRSSYSSMTQINDNETEMTNLCPKPLLTDEQIQECLSSSSPATSMVHENEYEQHSSSSKIYNDYKKRASLTSVPTNTIDIHSMIIHPMHTKIGLRSSTSSSSTNEKLTDMTLSSKQMNVCVINQLNEHLSTRFPKQLQACSNSDDHLSYDPPPEHMSENNNTTHFQSTVYNEPNELPIVKEELTGSLPVPPPPPPLPAGGFRSIKPPMKRSSQPAQISSMTLPREGTNSEMRCSTGTSTISSNLSDTRILSELRENPLFTRAKKHLDIEPGSNGRRSGRRLIGSTSNLSSTETTTVNQTISYVRLDKCSQKSIDERQQQQQQPETIIMHRSELDAILGKRTKSSVEINQTKSRSCTRSLIQSHCRLSELELIFQKRAQRSEQNLT